MSIEYEVALFKVCFGISVAFLLAIDASNYIDPRPPGVKMYYFVTLGVFPFIMLSLILTLIVFAASFYLCPEINDIVEFLYPGVVPVIPPAPAVIPPPYVHTPINWDTIEDFVKNDLNKLNKKRNY